MGEVNHGSLWLLISISSPSSIVVLDTFGFHEISFYLCNQFFLN